MQEGLRWSVSTASYQIAGAATEDGRGRSVRDEFVERPGAPEGGGQGRDPDDIPQIRSSGSSV
ncbi:family 1 glycosylhydrolase [Kitasatospora sp. NPDC049258]|uniref:family 1 glycosylhydrolase n=1 Tax=Kitasatospora sp. NPDC049258 TaxID=3155394 RepID=UPI00342003DC